jgi:adenylate cyclase
MQARTPDTARLAIPLLAEALSLGPEYAVAHAHLAWCREWCFTRGGLNEADRTAALVHARTAIASDTDDAASLAVAGWVIIVLTKDRAMALSAIERALSLNASCTTAHYFAALVNAFADRSGAATFHANRALRLSPFDPSAFEAHLALGMAALRAAQYDEAVVCFARGWQINRRHSLFPFFHAIALALAGRAAEARALGPARV